MQTLTQKQLNELLTNLGNKVPFIGLDVKTQPKIKKDYDPIIKTCKVTGRAGARVKNPIGPRKWGQRIEGTPLVEHKGTFYLELEVTAVKDVKYLDTGTNDYLNEIDAFERGCKNRSGVGLRDYKLTSITGIRINGEEYTVLLSAN